MRTSGAAAAVVLCVVTTAALGACASDSPRPAKKFPLTSGDTRVFRVSESHDAELRKAVRLPPGTRSVVIRASCTQGRGDIHVAVGPSGGGGGPCDGNGPVTLKLGGAAKLVGQRVVVHVTAPETAAWSAAVDASPTSSTTLD